MVNTVGAQSSDRRLSPPYNTILWTNWRWVHATARNQTSFLSTLHSASQLQSSEVVNKVGEHALDSWIRCFSFQNTNDSTVHTKGIIREWEKGCFACKMHLAFSILDLEFSLRCSITLFFDFTLQLLWAAKSGRQGCMISFMQLYNALKVAIPQMKGLLQLGIHGWCSWRICKSTTDAGAVRWTWEEVDARCQPNHRQRHQTQQVPILFEYKGWWSLTTQVMQWIAFSHWAQFG